MEITPRNPVSLRLEMAREGDIRSFIHLVQPLYERLFAYAFLMTGSVQDAQAILAEALQKAREGIDDIATLSFERYAVRHVRRATMGLIQSRPYEAPPEPAQQGLVTLASALAEDDGDAVIAIALPLLLNLSPEERDVVLLSTLLAIPPDGIEAVCGHGQDVIAARFRRAVRQMDETGRMGAGFAPPPAPQGATDELALSPLWEQVGQTLAENAPRPIHGIEEIILHRTPRARARVSSPAESARSASSRVRRIVWAAFLLLAGAGAAWTLKPSGNVESPAHFVRVTFHDEVAEEVHILGDFNGWSTPGVPLRLRSASGLWEAWIEVPLGRHRYVFLVDRERRVSDPLSAENVLDGQGGNASILYVESP